MKDWKKHNEEEMISKRHGCNCYFTLKLITIEKNVSIKRYYHFSSIGMYLRLQIVTRIEGVQESLKIYKKK